METGRRGPQTRLVTVEPAGLRRDRLLGAAYGPEVPSVVVSGEPGSGKTTLLTHFSRALWLRGFTIAWCAADPAGRIADFPTRFLRAVYEAVTGQRRRSASIEMVADLAGHTTSPVAVIVDDVHLLDPQSQAFISRVVRMLPPAVRFLLASQTPALGCVASLSATRETAELGGEDLRFRDGEVERLFREVYAEPIERDDALMVARHTDGWITGIHMLHLVGRRGERPRRQDLRELWCGSGPLRRYVRLNVLDRLEPDTSRFLLYSSVLPLLSPYLCDEVLDRRDSATVLRWLADRNLFVRPCDRLVDGYRLHPVLRRHLEADLVEGAGLDGARSLYRHAGQLLEAAGLSVEALSAYGRAGDWRASARLAAPGRGGEEPDGPDGRAWCALLDARRALDHGRPADALADYDVAAASFPAGPLRRECVAERQLVLAWATPGAVPAGPVVDHWLWETQAVLRSCPQRLLGHPRAGTEAGWALAAGLAELLCGRPDAAMRRLDLAAQSPMPLIRHPASILRLAVTGYGDPGKVAALDAVAAEAEEAGLMWAGSLARAARAVCGDPDLLAEADRIAAQRKVTGDLWNALLARIAVAVGCHAAGQDPEEVLAQCVADASALGAGTVVAWARADLARVAMLRGAPDAAQLRAEAYRTATQFGIPHAVDALLTRRVQQRAVAGASTMSVRCFGRYELTISGQPVDWRRLRPRARSALRLLSLRAGGDVHVEALYEAFWPAASPDTARRNLHVTISTIRALLEPHRSRGDSMLQRHGDGYRLMLPFASQHDVQRFNAALESWRRRRPDGPAAVVDPLREALAAYTGDLLPEDGSAEWIATERESLRAAAVAASAALATALLEQADYEGAIDAALRGLRIDRFYDRVWRLLIGAYDHAGDIAAARRTRDEYRAMLADLGIHPAG